MLGEQLLIGKDEQSRLKMDNRGDTSPTLRTCNVESGGFLVPKLSF